MGSDTRDRSSRPDTGRDSDRSASSVNARIARNLRLYPWYLASTWEGVSNAVWFLYLFAYKGLSLEQMAWLVLLGGLVGLAYKWATG